MKLSVERNALAGALARAVAFADARSPVPILGCVKLGTTDSGLTITATDMDAEINETLPATVEQSGSLCVSAARLSGLVRGLNPCRVEIAQEGGQIKLRAARTVASFDVIDSRDFPEFISVGALGKFSVTAGELDRVLAMALPSMDAAGDRAQLFGLFITVTDGGIDAVSSDGHRGTICRLTPEGEIGAFAGTIVPRPICIRLRSLMKGLPGSVSVEIGERLARISGGSWSINTKLIDESFPDYTRWSAPRCETPVSFDGDELVRLLEMAEAATEAEGRFHGVRLEVSGGALTLHSGGLSASSVNSEMEVSYSGAPVGVGFNARYLRDAASVLGGGELELHIRDAGSPGRVCRKGETEESVTVMAYRR